MTPLWAVAAADNSAELQLLQQQIGQLQKSLEIDNSKSARLQRELRTNERHINRVTNTLAQLKNDLATLDDRIVDLRQQGQQQQQALIKQRQLLAVQIRTSYQTGRQEQLKLLLNQENPATVGRILSYYNYLNQARSNEIATLQATLQRIAALDQELLETQQQTQTLLQKQQLEKSNLEQSKQQRQQVLQRLQHEIKGKGEELNQLKRSEQELQDILEQIEESVTTHPVASIKHYPFAQQRGKLQWPTKGRLIHNFGSSRHVGALRWNGVVIQAKEGVPVRAVSDGLVVYADWLRGYGLMVILDHGDGYMSLYGQNQTIFKEVGERVAKDDIVSHVGSSGGFDQSALYFEIRRNGKPTNPKQWVRG